MSSLSVRDPAMDRSLRSVFVGNIPYEATEEQLKDIFSEVGSVVSFRLVYDRETGKPKGYGFCEYQDQETALSAMRNLNGREFSGRALRVDNAASEKNKEELKSLGPAAPIIDSPYGDPIDPEDAPESITRAVASLPPEQMFELMKQMKLCVQNSHQEARNMLLQNPQLAYALLQAQVVMRIMDPEIALKILHRKIHVTPLIPGKSQPVSGPVAGPGAGPGAGPVAGPVSGPGPGPGLCPGPNVLLNQQNPPAPQPQHLARRPVKDIPPLMQTPIQGGIPAPGPMPAAVPGPGSLAPGGALQPQVGMPVVGPVPLERGQMQMSDPRAPMPRGPMTAGGLPPRGLLGDAPNDPRGGTLLSVTHTGEVEPRGYLGPPHQGPPMHHGPGHDGRGPSSHEMRGGPITDPRMLIGEPRGPMIDQRVLPLDGRGGRDSRGMETRAMETEVLEARVMERRGMETCAMEARGMDGRGMEIRGPGPSSRGPMTSGIQGPGPINMGAGGPQGPRQVPSISGVGNPGAGMQGAGMQGPGMQGAGMQGPGMQGPGMQGAGMQGAGMQGAGMQGASMQGGGMQGAGMQGTGVQGASKQSGGQPSSFSPGQSQVTPQDQEKAALIMQVLQLTADQIAMLPPEQRQSILILKEQIQKSTGGS